MTKTTATTSTTTMVTAKAGEHSGSQLGKDPQGSFFFCALANIAISTPTHSALGAEGG